MYYRLSNKNRGYIHQIANRESRARVYRTMSIESTESHTQTATSRKDPRHATSSQDQLPEDGDAVARDLCAHYWMSKNPAYSTDFTQWLIDNREDRALHVSLYTKPVIA